MLQPKVYIKELNIVREVEMVDFYNKQVSVHDVGIGFRGGAAIFSFDKVISSLVRIGFIVAFSSFISCENTLPPIIKNNIANPNEYFTLLYLFAIERKVFSILLRLLFTISTPYLFSL